jgi:transcription antitermination factor NusG
MAKPWALEPTGSSMPDSGPVVDLRTSREWYAVYTYSHHERRVRDQLQNKGVEHFAPFYSEIRNGKNGRARLELPLFPGYVFVKVSRAERVRVLESTSVVCIVGTTYGPACIPACEIERLRAILELHEAEPYAYFHEGDRARIRNGPFSGTVGFLIRKKRADRFVLSVETIMRSIAIEIDSADIEVLSPPRFLVA